MQIIYEEMTVEQLEEKNREYMAQKDAIKTEQRLLTKALEQKLSEAEKRRKENQSPKSPTQVVG